MKPTEGKKKHRCLSCNIFSLKRDWLQPQLKSYLKMTKCKIIKVNETHAEMIKRISGTIGTFCENYQESREGISFSQNKIKLCSQ